MNTNYSPGKNRVIKNYHIQNHLIKIEQIADVDQLINNISDEEFNVDERIPYWAELWPSAFALANYILQNKDIFSGKKILELGCGLGLAGIAATIAGATVLFSDYEEEALDFVKRNYFHNFKERADTIILDWRHPQMEKFFEIIIAADVLYEKKFLTPIYRTILKLIKSKGSFYLTEPNRTIGIPFFEMAKSGFRLLEQHMLNIQLEQKKSVTLYIFEKC